MQRNTRLSQPAITRKVMISEREIHMRSFKSLKEGRKANQFILCTKQTVQVSGTSRVPGYNRCAVNSPSLRNPWSMQRPPSRSTRFSNAACPDPADSRSFHARTIRWRRSSDENPHSWSASGICSESYSATRTSQQLTPAPRVPSLTAIAHGNSLLMMRIEAGREGANGISRSADEAMRKGALGADRRHDGGSRMSYIIFDISGTWRAMGA